MAKRVGSRKVDKIFDQKEEKECEDEKPFRCNLCGFRTKYPKALQTHKLLTIHSDKRPFSCDWPGCSYKAKLKGTLTAHKRLHQADRGKRESCSICPYKARDPSELQKHMRTHVSEDERQVWKVHTCPYCDYKAEKREVLFNHIRRHTGEKPFACDECEFTTSTRNCLKNHKMIHVPEKRFHCTLCEYKGRTSSTLISHRKNAHKIGRFHQCDQCDFHAVSGSKLKQHKLTAHTTDKPFVCPFSSCTYKSSRIYCVKTHYFRRHQNVKPFNCPQCPYACKDPKSLRVHLRIHTGEKPHVCQQCEYAAVCSSSLKNHVRARHTKEKRYKCSQCESAFVQKTQLNAHVAWKHSEDRPFHCPFCSYRSKTKEILGLHIRSHTGEKPFKCPHCEFRFSVTRNLMNHQKRMMMTTRTKCKVKSCHFQTGYRCDLKQHMDKVHGGDPDRNYPCSVCPYRAKYGQNLRQHELVVHKIKKIFKCPFPLVNGQTECHFEGKSQKLMSDHVRQFHCRLNNRVNKEYCCTYQNCQFKYKSQSSLFRHFKASHVEEGGGEKRYKCSQCDYKTSTSSTLKIHMVTVTHSNVRPFKCPQCPWAFKFKAKLDRHINSHDGGPGGRRVSQWHRKNIKELGGIVRDVDLRRRGMWCKVCSFWVEDGAELAKHLDDSHALPIVLLTRILESK